MKESLIVRLLKYGIYLCALVPLVIVSQYISPFHFGKVVYFRSLIELMVALYLVLIWKDKSYRPRFDKISWLILAFATAFSLATIFSINSFMSFWGTLERMGGVWAFWHYVFFYFILTSVLRTKKDWQSFLDLTISVGIVSAIYGFLQRFNISFIIGADLRPRIFGTIGNPALFAGYQLFIGFLSAAMFFSARQQDIDTRPGRAAKFIGFGGLGYLVAILLSAVSEAFSGLWVIGMGFIVYGIFLAYAKSGKIKRWYALAALIPWIAAAMTAVRGSLLGLGVGLLVLAFLYFQKEHSKLAKRILLSLVTFAAIFVVVALSLSNTSFIKKSGYLSRVTNFSLTNYTVETRFWAWQAGLEGWKEKPQYMLVGWGPENFNIPFSEHFNPGFFRGTNSETLFDRAHNMFVEILVTMGVLGLTSYIGLFVAIFILLKSIKKNPEHYMTGSVFISMMIAYIIHNSFIFDTSANFIAFFSIMAYISFLYRGERPIKEAARYSSGAMATAFVLILAAAFLLYKTNVKETVANFTTTRGIVNGWAGNLADSISYYKKALEFNGEGRYEIRNSYAQFVLDHSNDKNFADFLTDNINNAITWEEINAKQSPHDYLPELYLSRLYIVLGRGDANSPYNDVGLSHSLKALSYSETFVRTYYEVGQGYLNKKDYPNAEKYFLKAVELNPDVSLSYWYVGATYMQAGDLVNGVKYIQLAIDHGYGLSEQDYLNLANVYIKNNDFPHLVTIYEKLIGIAPDNAKYYASLAVAYAKVGRLDDASTQAHKAAQIDSSYTDQAKSFVQSIGKQW